MTKMIDVLAYAVLWLTCGFIMALYFKQFLCRIPRECKTCKEIKTVWNRWAWRMDIVFAFFAIPYLFLVFK